MMNRLAALGLVPIFAACTTPTQDGVAQSSDELVTSQAFSQAADVIRGIDYLPFNYKEDGCYARSLYMAMELAAIGRESNAIFAFAKPGTALQVGDIRWGYHVAPMLFVGTSYDDAKWMVLDPSISRVPLDSAAWVAKMGFPAGTPQAEYPTLATVPGTALGPDDPDFDATYAAQSSTPITDVPSFGEMPVFQVSDIQLSCNAMRSYLEKEGAPDLALKAQKLVARTSVLIASLQTRGKLSADAVFDAAQCASST
jgi:hypothetical protein